jgi:hypothetical protein
VKDLKEALGSTRKPDITHVRSSIMRYIARACEYGSARYERANYARPAGDDREPSLGLQARAIARADFERFRSYLRAAVSHLMATLDSMEHWQSCDPNLENISELTAAAYAQDTDAKPGCPIGASGLPHVAHAAASLMMAIEQATLYGLLPEDPGQPWAERAARPLETLAAEVAQEFTPTRPLDDVDEAWFAGKTARQVRHG